MIPAVKIPPALKRHYPFALYTIAFVLAWLAGMRMWIPYPYFQFLGADWLRDDLARSMLCLHSQPPLPNFLLGLALKCSWTLGLTPEAILLAVHFTAGLAGVACITSFTRAFVRNPRLADLCICLLLLHPVLYAAATQYFYTFHEWVLLALLAWAFQRHVAAPGWRRFAVVALVLTAIVYTRSLFHFLWALAVLAALAWQGLRRAGPNARTAYGVVMAMTVVVLFAWPVKNLALFGFFGYSSWQGANLAQGIADINDFPVPVETDIPPRFKDVPCIAEPFKILHSTSSEEVVTENHNHYSLIGTSRKMQTLAFEMIRDDPGRLWRKIRHNYWAFTRFTGRQPHYAAFGLDQDVTGFFGRAWMKLYEVILNQDFRPTESLKTATYRTPWLGSERDQWMFSLLWIAMPVVLSLSVVRVGVQLWRGKPEGWTGAFLIFTVLWVIVMVLLVDGKEGNRMRFSTEPYYLWLVFRLVDGIAGPKRLVETEGRKHEVANEA